jgi:hypothetical protein
MIADEEMVNYNALGAILRQMYKKSTRIREKADFSVSAVEKLYI